jgi:transposase
MSTKAIQAKVIIEKPEQLQALWQVHSIFNQYLSENVIKSIFAMRRGEFGPECKSIADNIAKSQQAIGDLEAITKPVWKTKKTTNPDAQAYEKVKPKIDNAIGQIRGWIKSDNLDKWIKVFNQQPMLINWRGKTDKLNPIPTDKQEKIEKIKARIDKKKTAGVAGKKRQKTWQEMELQEFLRANTEIKTLDKTRREYLKAEESQRIRSGKLPFNYKEWKDGFAKRIHRKIFEEAQAVIAGYKALVQNWEREHKEWLDEKEKWEKEHQSYINTYRQRFLSFEKEVRGKITKKRRRWRIYLDWLMNNPDLAAWRGKPAEVKPIPPEGLERIKKAWRRKKVAREFEEFFKVNPELKALDEAHKAYEENFIRRQAKKKNPDGFRHRSTFTMPSITKHPRWFNFQRDVGYQDLDIQNGHLKVTIPSTDSAGKKSFIWAPYKFKADTRLNLFGKMSKEQADQFARDYKMDSFKNKNRQDGIGIRKIISKPYTFVYADRQLKDKNGKPLERPAEIRGVKLIFKPAKSSGMPYLVFSCDIPDLPVSDAARKYTKEKVTNGLVTCAVDLGIHHIAVASIRQNGKILRTRVIWDEDANPTKNDKLQAGPGLKHIDQHKRQLRRLRRLRGRPIKNEESCVELQEHSTNMGEDRFKKAARKIVNFALNTDGYAKTKDGKTVLNQPMKVPPADILILENLKSFTTSAEREQEVNTALANWSKGHIVEWVKRLAKDAGIYTREVRQYYTSQICSKCGSLGRRYSIHRNKDTKEPEVRFGGQRSLFGCPNDNCLLGINADYNASLNIHKVFYNDFPKVKKIKERVCSVNAQEVKIDEVEDKIKERLGEKGIIKYKRPVERPTPEDLQEKLHKHFAGNTKSKPEKTLDNT